MGKCTLEHDMVCAIYPKENEVNAYLTAISCSAICLEEVGDNETVRHLGCEHTFHASCIVTWYLAEHDTCPICAYNFVVARPVLQKPCQAYL